VTGGFPAAALTAGSFDERALTVTLD